MVHDILAVGAGTLVGIVLGLIGGGGSILAVPLLVYVVGVQSTHVAIGTSAVAVAVTALSSLVVHGRGGNVRLGIKTAQGTKWLNDASHIVTSYRPGELLYAITDPLLGRGRLGDG